MYKIKHSNRVQRPPIFNSIDQRKSKPLPKIKHSKEPPAHSLRYTSLQKYHAEFANNQDIFEDLVLLSRKRMEIPREFFAETFNRRYSVVWLAEQPRFEILEPSNAAWYPQFNADPGPTALICRIGIEQLTGNLCYGVQSIKRQDASRWDDLGSWQKVRYWQHQNIDSLYKLKSMSEIRKLKGAVVTLDSSWLTTISKKLSEYLLFLKPGEELTFKEIFTVTNQEIRRSLIMRAGYERLKAMSEVQVIDKHEPTEAELISIEDWGTPIGSDGTHRGILRFLKVKDSSTDRIYLLPVPRWAGGLDINTVQLARAWGFGFLGNDAKQFKPLVET